MGELAPSAAIAGVITGLIFTVFSFANELWALGVTVTGVTYI